MIRDIIKDEAYFDQSIKKRESLIEKNINRITNGNLPLERINISKENRVGLYKNNLIAKYSRGDNMSTKAILNDFINAVNLMEEIWSPKRWNMSSSDSTRLDQYTFSSYLDFSRMLSLAVLIPAIEKEYVLKLIRFIDGDSVKDFFLEFLIQYFIPNRESIEKESYVEFFHINERYGTLKDIIVEKDKNVAEGKIKEFLTNKWYQSFKGTPLYNQHNNPRNTYVGYWCFQAAAITKIMQLDDSQYKENQYYPKDMLL